MQQSVSGTRDKRNSLLQTMLRKRMPDGGGAFSHSRMSGKRLPRLARSEEHTSELQSLMRISYAVFCLKKKTSVHSIININQSANDKENDKTHKRNIRKAIQ